MLTVRRYDCHEDDFYCLMGRFFANRKYAQEMGGWQFYTKEQSVWFLGLVRGEVAGFCSIIHERTHLFFDNQYVVKEWRGNGFSNVLHAYRMEYARQTGKEIRCISDNPIEFRKFERDGFEVYGMRGRYTKFRWIPK